MREAPRPGAPAVSHGVIVRPAVPRDAPEFLEVYRDVVGEGRHIRTEHVTRSVRDYRKSFRRSWDDRHAFLVAVAGGRVVGWLSIGREEQAVTRHVATFGMAVAAPWRHRGVGSALIEEALRWARGAAIEKIELTVYPHNGAAIALYRKLGFVEEGRLVRHSKKSYGYEDEILMGLWIGDEGQEAGEGE